MLSIAPKSRDLIILTHTLILLYFISITLCLQDLGHLADVENHYNKTKIVASKESISNFWARSNIIPSNPHRCKKVEDELDRCSAKLIAMGNSEVSYPRTMDELNSLYCPKFKSAVNCIKSSTESCYNNFEKQIIHWVLYSTRRMNKRRCKIENEKVKFLRLTNTCFTQMKGPMDDCMNNYIAGLEAIVERDKFIQHLSEDDYQIQLSCCANKRFNQCIMEQAENQCKPLDGLEKLRRTNSVSSQRMAKKLVQKSMSEVMKDLNTTLTTMALTGPELFCQGVSEEFCLSKFDGKLLIKPPKYRSIVPPIIKIYSNKE